MDYYCKYKHYVITVTSKRNITIMECFNVFDTSSINKTIIVKSIYDICTQKYLNELECDDIKEFKNHKKIFKINQIYTNDNYTKCIGSTCIELEIQSLRVQFKINHPIFIHQNLEAIPHEIYEQQIYKFPVFIDYDVAYFHNFLEQKQYELFPNGFCGIAKEYYKYCSRYEIYPIRCEIFMNNNKFEGTQIIYNQYGKIVEKINWINGKKNGLTEYFKCIKYLDIITKSIMYKEDKRHGDEIDYFLNEDNNIRLIKTFNNDVIESYKRYNENGELVEERKYNNGLKI